MMMLPVLSQRKLDYKSVKSLWLLIVLSLPYNVSGLTAHSSGDQASNRSAPYNDYDDAVTALDARGGSSSGGSGSSSSSVTSDQWFS
ncbi:hypothetical protein M0802_004218 [Mischocyttarus mexicanus]|nr:hypothetical protein M0802_004218 [Mischocyttarus mexicanus]